MTADKEGWILRKLQSFTSRQFIGWRQQSYSHLQTKSHLHQPSKHSDAGINVIIFTSWQLIAALGEFRVYTAEFLETGGNGTESVHYVRLFREFLTTLCFAWRWRGKVFRVRKHRDQTTHNPSPEQRHHYIVASGPHLRLLTSSISVTTFFLVYFLSITNCFSGVRLQICAKSSIWCLYISVGQCCLWSLHQIYLLKIWNCRGICRKMTSVWMENLLFSCGGIMPSNIDNWTPITPLAFRSLSCNQTEQKMSKIVLYIFTFWPCYV